MCQCVWQYVVYCQTNAHTDQDKPAETAHRLLLACKEKEQSEKGGKYDRGKNESFVVSDSFAVIAL